jgi:hypothetical protein
VVLSGQKESDFMVVWFFIINITVGSIGGIVTGAEMKVGRFLTQAQCQQARQDLMIHLEEPVPPIKVEECRMKLVP